MAKHNFAYDVSTLPSYTEEPAKVILNRLFTKSAILEASKGNLMTGVKSAETINIIANEAIWQTDGCGAINPSGSTAFTQRTVTVGKIKVEQSFCEKTLESKFTQKLLTVGSTYTRLALNTEIVEAELDSIGKRTATAVWQGNTSNWSAYLNKYDGLIKTIDAATIGGTYSGTVWSEANSRTVIKGLAALIIADQDVYKGGATDIKMYMSPAMAAQYRWKLIVDNLYHIDPKDSTQKLYAEGTTIEIVEDAGLSGITKIYAIEPNNVYPATDAASDEENIDVWYSQDDNVIYMRANWKFGVNVAFPTRIYSYLGV